MHSSLLLSTRIWFRYLILFFVIGVGLAGGYVAGAIFMITTNFILPMTPWKTSHAAWPALLFLSPQKG